MKNILFFHPSSELYGADKILLYVLNNFKDHYKIVILKNDGPLIDKIYGIDNTHVRIIPKFPIIAKKNLSVTKIFSLFVDILTFIRISRSLKKEFRPALIYLNTLATYPILFYFSSEIKKIVHLHEILLNNKILHRILNKSTIRKSDMVICVSDAVKRNLIHNSHKNSSKIIVIHNGINFINKGKEHIRNGKMRFALIGRIKPSHKGQLLFIHAISLLKKEILEKADFLMVGSTVTGQEYMLEEVNTEIEKHGLKNCIKILPFVAEIENVYANTDVIVVPSTFDDPFPTTVLEAMFFSKPVIGTNVGGIPEMIIDKQTGFIVERNNAMALSSAIEKMINDPENSINMGKLGKSRFESHFTEDCFNERFSLSVQSILGD